MATKYPKQKTVILQIKDFSKGLDAQKDENIVGFNNSVNTFNFDFSSGALKDGVDFGNLTLPTSEQVGATELLPTMPSGIHDYASMAHFRGYSQEEGKRVDTLFLFTKQNEVLRGRMIDENPKFQKYADITFNGKPRAFNCVINSKDYLFLFGANDPFRLYYDGATSFVTQSDVIPITDLCQYLEYNVGIVGSQRDQVRFDIIYPTNWGDSAIRGKDIKLDGQLGQANRLLKFNDYIFVIRDFGISRIAWYKSADYSVNNLLFSGSKVYGETACICGDRGLMLCKDGIYEFNSITAKKLDLPFNKFFEGVTNNYACATFKDGIYYLACQLNFDDGKLINCELIPHQNNALIVLDTSTNHYTIYRGLDINDLCTVQVESVDKVIATFNSNFETQVGQVEHTGKNFNLFVIRYWQTPLSDLGYPDQEKFVKEISLNTQYDVVCKIFTENETRRLDIKGSDEPIKIPIKIKGNKIGLSFETRTERAYISNLKMKVDLLDKMYV